MRIVLLRRIELLPEPERRELLDRRLLVVLGVEVLLDVVRVDPDEDHGHGPLDQQRIHGRGERATAIAIA